MKNKTKGTIMIKKKTTEGTQVHLYYRPAKHEGQPNKTNKAFPYDVTVFESFANIANKEPFAGFEGIQIDTGKWKRFRMDRVISMVAID
jgi:hypothetical protein